MIYLASILLEPNRWKPGRPPSIRASDWSARAATAGFDGWELFENHYRKADAAERRRLELGPLPVRVFNTYETFEDATRPELKEVSDCARRLGANGVKFNVGNDPVWRENWRAAIDAFPAGPRLLCECHPGTALETPEATAEFAARWPAAPFDVIIHPFLLGPEGVACWLQLLGPRVRHAHVQMRARHDSRQFLALNDDAPRARECLAALMAGGYAGSFSLEFAAPTGGAADEPEALFTAARRDLDFLREHILPR